ncbi:MAG: hypothetical protein ABS58_07705 [Mesorhizobium sp. SCN 65-20]|nr:MAG: hypothetical protein ABS58_07705 [Mesorhizobium sp. SCN 65-20]
MDVDFGNFRLKRTERLLLGPRGQVELSARSFDILAILLERPDEVIGKTELFDAVWPGLVVGENTLQVHISSLRKLLPADMIVTVHGRGYKYAGPRPSVTTAEALSLPRASIAVLPFANMSSDAEYEYFADGVAEDIITMGAGRGSVVARNATAAGVPNDRMLLFPDIESNVSALRAGRIDVAVLSSPTVIGLLNGGSAQGLERAPFVVADEQANYAAVAFRKEDEDLKALYDAQLAALRKDGTVAGIMAKYGFGTPEAVPETMTADKLCSGSVEAGVGK